MPFITKGDSVAVVDATVKNKKRWEWLRVRAADGRKQPFEEWYEKMDRPGIACCRSCNMELKYGANGEKSLLVHASSTDHVDRIRGQTC